MCIKNYCVIDYESYWASKDYTLSKMSAIDYVRDPRFYAQMMGVSVNGGAPVVFEHDDIPAALQAMQLDKLDTLLIGHNSSGFDNLILSEVYGIHPAFMTDTMHLMRWTGVSRVIRENLASMTHWFGTGEKRAGTVISDGKRTKEDFTHEEWEDFKRYCAEDVAQTTACFERMLPFMTKDSILFSSLTCRMATEPCFVVDPEPLRAYIEDLKRREAETFAKLKTIFKFREDVDFLKHIRSAAKFENLLRMVGCEPPMKISPKQTAAARKKWEAKLAVAPAASKSTIEGVLANEENYAVYTPALAKGDLEFLELLEHPNPYVRLLVSIRLEHNSSVAMSRAQNLLRMAEYGKPMPILLKCYYAHTSRYGAGAVDSKSDGIQVQNIPKHNKSMKPLRQSIKAPSGYRVVACDSSQIEARVLAYEAQNVELLEHFRHGRDPYAEMASKFGYNMTAQEIHDGAKSGDKLAKMLRQVGKKLILSCGYGTSATKLSDTLLRENVPLDENKEEHKAIVTRLHKIYRDSNVSIVKFWKQCDTVIREMIAGHDGMFGGPNNDLFKYGMFSIPGGKEKYPGIELPTGYILRYPNLRIEYDDRGKSSYFYDRPLGKNMVKTRCYGCSCVENLTQSLAFQILMYQAVRMSEKGIPIHCNIHDSFAAVVPDHCVDSVKETMLACMKEVPAWVEGLPLDAEAEVAEDFTIV